MSADKKIDLENNTADVSAAEEWVKPEITSFSPVTAAKGISYRPNDGISNLT